MRISGWGNFPIVESHITSLRRFQSEGISNIDLIPRGMGRSYGDSSLSTRIVSTLRHNRILQYDRKEGSVTVESGVVLSDLLDIIVPDGWFVPVTPGTRYVTIGGMVASDVHGKNHHRDGSFGRHIEHITLQLADKTVLLCSTTDNSQLFYATIGGMGLTGVILEVSFRLLAIETAYVRQESIRVKNIFEAMDVFESSNDWTYSVAWIDCLAKGESLGRSIVMRGEHLLRSETSELQLESPLLVLPKRKKYSVPFFFPDFALNRWSIKLFNALYYRKVSIGKTKSIIDYQTYFYPLDAINKWNRIYGKSGFIQYQFVVPKENSREIIPRILTQIADTGCGSFLAVLKLFGKSDKGLLSFPREGYTLALDFPIGSTTFSLLDKLDEIVHAAGGRIYLSKDSRMHPRWLNYGYDNIQQFQRIKKEFDRDNRFKSMQSERLGITTSNNIRVV